LRIGIRALTTIQLSRFHALIKCRIAHRTLSSVVSSEASISIATSARNQLDILVKQASSREYDYSFRKPPSP
jgi:hypothetical protein